MPRRLSSIAALMGAFARARRGATAVEFALISMPMMLLLFGILELLLILIVSVTLETATEFTARDIRTGVFQMSGANGKNDYKAKVCRNMNWLEGVCASKLFVEAETFDTFGQAGASSAAAPNTFNPNQTCWSVGAPEDIVLVRSYLEWPIVTPLIQPFFKNYGSGERLLSAARVFRNEPFNPALRRVGGRCASGS